jgi:Mn-dependent DtxR family transcriptional regulator
MAKQTTAEAVIGDLRRLRLKGMITRLPHTNTYVLTDEGQRVAIFYTKVHHRLLRPLLAARDLPAPLTLRQALRVINHHVEDYVSRPVSPPDNLAQVSTS